MSTQNALKLLFELRVVLDRLGENESLYEAVAQDAQEAIRLTDECISELTQGSEPSDDEGGAEDGE